jgi:hypothetical protein
VEVCFCDRRTLRYSYIKQNITGHFPFKQGLDFVRTNLYYYKASVLTIVMRHIFTKDPFMFEINLQSNSSSKTQTLEP